MPALEARDVTMRRCGRSLVQRVSMTADRGELLALCGPEGSGTRTVLHLLSGHLLPDAGTVLVDGRERGPRRRPPARRSASRSRTGPTRPSALLAAPGGATVLLLERPTAGLDAVDAHALLRRRASPRRRRRGGSAHRRRARRWLPTRRRRSPCSSPVACVSWGAPPVALVPAVHIVRRRRAGRVRRVPSSLRRRSTTASSRRVRTTGSAGGARRGSAWSRACSSTGRSTRRDRT